MGLKKQVWNWLKGRLPSPRQPREQAQPSAHSDDPGPLTASSHPEPPTIKVMASSGGSAAPVTDDVYRHGYSEEGTDHTQVPTPTSSQATHLPQPGHGSHLESPMIMATAPPEQPATLLIEGAEPHLGSIGQSPGATSTSPLVEAWEGEEARGRLEVPMSVSPRTNSRSSSRQGRHSQTGSGGVLTGAHNFSVGQMNAVEILQHVANQSVHNHMGTNPLEKMLPYVIPGAEFNSAARDPPPRCHPDTRAQIRADIQNRINGTERLIWMHGPAGVGKSAIMQTIAETMSTSATLFFSRSSDPPRNDSKKVFTTLAYRLAADNADYREYIEQSMYQDPTFLAISLAEQFNRLFIAPFIDNLVEPGPQRWVVLLDGLDECENDHNNQCRIVDLIGDSILHHAGVMPFVWVIASRPEAHLIGALRYLKENFQDHPADFLECEIPIDSDDAAQDVERYLHTEFTKIRKDNPDAFPHSTSTWPSEDDFLKVAGASSGLFVFASTVTKYISVDRPASRLKLITSLIDQCKLNSTRISSKPFTLLDMLYTQVMSDIPEDLLPVAKSLLGYFHLLTEQSLFLNGLVVACNILGLRQDEAYDALRKLHSVLSCPHPGNAEDHGIKFFHTSFSDFLFDRSRSQNYYVDLDQECTNIWRCYTRILKESCRADASALVPHCDSVTIHWAHMNGDSHLDRTRERLLWVAQHNYISLLVKYGHSWCTSCSSLRAARCLLIDAPELIDAFRSIHPILFYAVTKRTKGFVDWVDKHAPKAIQEMMTSRVLPMSQLDTECLFESLCARPWCWYVIDIGMIYVDITVDVQDNNAFWWPHVKGELLGCNGDVHSLDFEEVVEAVNVVPPHQYMVRVVGMGLWSPCAVIGPFKARFGFTRNAFYVLPYSEK